MDVRSPEGTLGINEERYSKRNSFLLEMDTIGLGDSVGSVGVLFASAFMDVEKAVLIVPWSILDQDQALLPSCSSETKRGESRRSAELPSDAKMISAYELRVCTGNNDFCPDSLEVVNSFVESKDFSRADNYLSAPPRDVQEEEDV